jgi:septum site-determining protein MinC
MAAERMGPAVKVKGIKEGLLVTFGQGEWETLVGELLKYLDQQAEFLRGGRLALDVGNHVLKAVEMSRLRDLVSDRGLNLWCILSESPKTQETAQTLGLATRISKPAPERTITTLETSVSGDQAVLVRRTLRSGYSLSHTGHIVIIGDVNPGAEVIAGGDVVVWGRLRGMVHAGAEGDEAAVICALDMSPTQLRIAGKIAPPPDRRGQPQPEIARLQNGEVQAELWNPKGK